MRNQSYQLKISESLGSVSAEVTNGERTNAIMTLAHGAGAGMQHSFMTALANALAEQSISTLRFNFPFMEQKKKRPDVPAVAHKAVEAAIHQAHELFPAIPLFVSGKSFGGRMSSQYLSENPVGFVKGMIFVGFPLHPPGKPSTDRAEHLKKVNIPMLFLQGTRDELAEWNLIQQVTNDLSLTTRVKFDGADHAFKAGKQNLIPSIAESIRNWVDEKNG